ncbi:MAG: hypothetical protein AABX52_01945 [Nanoarchaeota archaeon]
MKFNLKTVFVGIMLLLLGSGIGIYYVYNKVTNPSTTPAFISDLDGSVEVNKGNGWKPAMINMELKQSDSIRTMDGEVEVVLLESVFVRFKKNTQGTLEELSSHAVRVKQIKGSLWNKVTRLFGVTGYEVTLPYTTATVRGTGFLTKISDEDQILVGEGEVIVHNKEQELVLNPHEKAVSKDSLQKNELTADEYEEIRKEISDDIIRLKRLRSHIMNKYQGIIEAYKKQYNTSDDQIAEYLDMIDRGELDDEKLINATPLKLPVMYHLKEINDLIKKEQRTIMLEKQ